jgi:hypothetical protein
VGLAAARLLGTWFPGTFFINVTSSLFWLVSAVLAERRAAGRGCDRRPGCWWRSASPTIHDFLDVRVRVARLCRWRWVSRIDILRSVFLGLLAVAWHPAARWV